ncbi:hypothetical protein P9239_05210 [Caballeronia sp. LZ062]|uniref:hypothetical protein n=1 Tax=unclassified Caballeronia TaxID=2646786 RepID=UPI002864FDA9|nr:MULTISPECIES: hypothetical protein [unclassified Caballeronia]MDR5856846.1 hypothetical protein [Caballeronia sp. LZ050]MDR5869757.1 hypothetical protein [Caballeronia sp. LZ062]
MEQNTDTDEPDEKCGTSHSAPAGPVRAFAPRSAPWKMVGVESTRRDADGRHQAADSTGSPEIARRVAQVDGDAAGIDDLSQSIR